MTTACRWPDRRPVPQSRPGARLPARVLPLPLGSCVALAGEVTTPCLHFHLRAPGPPMGPGRVPGRVPGGLSANTGEPAPGWVRAPAHPRPGRPGPPHSPGEEPETREGHASRSQVRPLGLTLTSQDLNSPGLGKATTGQPWKLQNTGILLVPGTEFLKPKPFQTTPRRIRLPPER